MKPSAAFIDVSDYYGISSLFIFIVEMPRNDVVFLLFPKIHYL